MAPVPIEDMIKVQMKDIVSNCMVLGDKRKHLACILTLRTVLDSANLPTDQVNMDCISLNIFLNMPRSQCMNEASGFCL